MYNINGTAENLNPFIGSLHFQNCFSFVNLYLIKKIYAATYVILLGFKLVFFFNFI